MPTGYTCKISEGQDFKTFALGCARQFGALIDMRDEPEGTPIKSEIIPSDYNKKELALAKRNLAKYEKMTVSEANLKAGEEYSEEVAYNVKREREKKELAMKYNKMLVEVKVWQLPSSEHQGLKDFMIEQIEKSIQWDCGYTPKEPILLTGEQWLLYRKEQAIKDIKYHTEGHEKEISRCNERSTWINQLLKSF